MNTFAIDCDVIIRRYTEHLGHGVEVWRSFSSTFIGSLCRVRKQIMYLLSWITVYSLTRVSFGVYFSRYLTTREVNIEITLSRAHKQFATWVHTIFYMSVTGRCQNIWWHSFAMPCDLLAVWAVFQMHSISRHPERWNHIKSLWPSNAIWRHGPGSILVQTMVYCLTAPSQKLNQYCRTKVRLTKT